MPATLTISSIPDLTFVKDGIDVTITTTTTNVQNHYIGLTITISGKSYQILHPVINGQAKFNISKIIESPIEKKFSLTEGLHDMSDILIVWQLVAFEVYNYGSPMNSTSPITKTSFIGSSGGNNIGDAAFLSKFNNRIIKKGEDIMLFLYVGSDDVPEISWEFIDENFALIGVDNVMVESSGVIQLYMTALSIPETTKKIIFMYSYINEPFTIIIDNSPVIDRKTIVYRNSFGAYDMISMNAHTLKKHNYIFNSFTNTIETKKYNTKYEEVVEKYDFVLSEKYSNEVIISDILKELYISEETYIIENNIAVPITITDTERVVDNTLEKEYLLKITYKKNYQNA